MVGMYFALGVKFQVPVLKHSYTVTDGQLQVQAYYPQHDVLLPDNDDNAWINHALGTTQIFDGENNKETEELPYTGNMNLKKNQCSRLRRVGTTVFFFPQS
jgi:hypothetical protein